MTHITRLDINYMVIIRRTHIKVVPVSYIRDEIVTQQTEKEGEMRELGIPVMTSSRSYHVTRGGSVCSGHLGTISVCQRPGELTLF